MAKTTLRYDKMVENALRSVVRDALAVTAAQGALPGAHHFYVTFRTDFPRVQVPDFLRAQYPHEMTIVIEHQFWGLEVDDIQFAVTLSFHSQPQRLVIPLAAITAFADPSVPFGLEFRAEIEAGSAAVPMDPAGGTSPMDATAEKPHAEKTAPEKPEPDKAGAVVKLDAFRKK